MGSELYMLVTLTAGNWGVKVIHNKGHTHDAHISPFSTGKKSFLHPLRSAFVCNGDV